MPSPGSRSNRIVSSPYLRCIESVEPLAEARGLEIELDERLAAHRLDDVPELLEELKGEHAVVCTHGELPWLEGESSRRARPGC